MKSFYAGLNLCLKIWMYWVGTDHLLLGWKLSCKNVTMNIDNEGHILRWNGYSNGFCKILCSTHWQRQLHNEETARHTASVEDITHCHFELGIV